jgi:hypothetical protein
MSEISAEAINVYFQQTYDQGILPPSWSGKWQDTGVAEMHFLLHNVHDQLHPIPPSTKKETGEY